MSQTTDAFWSQLRRISEKYPLNAYLFVQEGLRHTVGRLHELADGDSDAERHVSGRELCMGLREFALLQFGLLARTVLESWNIRRTEDFGQIVFNLVEAGLMRKSDDDRLDDFESVFDFDEAFGQDLEACNGSARADA